MALLRARPAVNEIVASGVHADEVTGARIVWSALAAPLRQIAANGGHEPGDVAATVEREFDDTGFNAATGQYEDLVKAAIVDPAKVVKAALSSRVSGHRGAHQRGPRRPFPMKARTCQQAVARAVVGGSCHTWSRRC